MQQKDKKGKEQDILLKKLNINKKNATPKNFINQITPWSYYKQPFYQINNRPQSNQGLNKQNISSKINKNNSVILNRNQTHGHVENLPNISPINTLQQVEIELNDCMAERMIITLIEKYLQVSKKLTSLQLPQNNQKLCIFPAIAKQKKNRQKIPVSITYNMRSYRKNHDRIKSISEQKDKKQLNLMIEPIQLKVKNNEANKIIWKKRQNSQQLFKSKNKLQNYCEFNFKSKIYKSSRKRNSYRASITVQN